MRICYLSIVAIVCTFGYGAAQTTATPLDLVDLDVKFLYIQEVTPVNERFFFANTHLYTLSLESSKSPNKMDIDRFTVRSPKQALNKADKTLSDYFSGQLWGSDQEKLKVYPVVMGFGGLRKFFEVLEKALIEYEPKQRQ